MVARSIGCTKACVMGDDGLAIWSGTEEAFIAEFLKYGHELDFSDKYFCSMEFVNMSSVKDNNVLTYNYGGKKMEVLPIDYIRTTYKDGKPVLVDFRMSVGTNPRKSAMHFCANKSVQSEAIPSLARVYAYDPYRFLNALKLLDSNLCKSVEQVFLQWCSRFQIDRVIAEAIEYEDLYTVEFSPDE